MMADQLTDADIAHKLRRQGLEALRGAANLFAAANELMAKQTEEEAKAQGTMWPAIGIYELLGSEYLLNDMIRRLREVR
jgi:hypothetical protein